MRTVSQPCCSLLLARTGMSFGDPPTTPFKSNQTSVFLESVSQETEKKFFVFFSCLLSLFKYFGFFCSCCCCLFACLASARGPAHTSSLFSFYLLSSCFHLTLLFFLLSPFLAFSGDSLSSLVQIYSVSLFTIDCPQQSTNVSPEKSSRKSLSRWCCGDRKGTGALSSCELQGVGLDPPQTAFCQIQEALNDPTKHGQWCETTR